MQLRHAVLPQKDPLGAEQRPHHRSGNVPNGAHTRWLCVGRRVRNSSRNGRSLRRHPTQEEPRADVEDLQELVVEEQVQKHAGGDVAENNGEC